MVVIEICVESLEEAITACKSGANRIELCDDLAVGGTTPSKELVAQVIEYCHAVNVKVYAMLRCRGGDFVYSNEEKSNMLTDCNSLLKAGVDGIVCGALRRDGSIDREFMKQIRRSSGSLPLTFHKAFDDSNDDVTRAMNVLDDIGFARILSSGRSHTALEGIDTLKHMVSLERPTVIVAGSVRAHNVNAILRATGPLEVHSRSPEICNAILGYRWFVPTLSISHVIKR